MKKAFVKTPVFLFAFVVATFVMATGLLTACGGGGAPPAPAANPTAPAGAGESATPDQSSDTDAAAKGLKIAMIMQGPISDMSWNYNAYYALTLMEKDGATISYNENADPADLVEYVRTYGSEGYNLVMINDDRNQEDVVAAAADFPDTQYIIVNSMTTSDNVQAIFFADQDQGFMAGVIAALLTQTGKVGFVGGLEFIPIINGAKGFQQGVAYIDPSIEAQVVYTGDFVDSVKAKNQALALIEGGADVLVPNADAASQGVVEAAQEKGVLVVTNGEGMETFGPDAVVISVNKDTYVGYYDTYQRYLAGTINADGPKVYGAGQGLISFGEWLDPTGVVTDDIRARVQQAMDALSNGEVVIDLN
ncbi:MAG: BMP family protein [Candidatus Promineofilum sp.]|nr:BMP family protein [Promineifilum sp.]